MKTSLLDLEYVVCDLCGKDSTLCLFKKNDFTLVKCKYCGLVYWNPRPSKRYFASIYENYGKNYYTTNKGVNRDFSQSKWVKYKEILDRLSSFKIDRRLLDVGCATGSWLSFAKQKGWDTYGVEISQPCTKYAQSLGLNVFCGSLQKAGYPDSFFDVVTYFEVVEHLHSPVSHIKQANRILKNRGIIIITTPNFESLTVRLLWKKYRYIGMDHLYYFTSSSLKNILLKHRFQIIYLETRGFNPKIILQDMTGHASIKNHGEKAKLFSETIRNPDPFVESFKKLPIKNLMNYFLRVFQLGTQLIIYARKIGEESN